MTVREFISGVGMGCLLLSSTLFSTAGCGKDKYERRDILPEDATWRGAAAVLAELADADEQQQAALLDRVVPSDVPAEKRAALQSLLRTITAGEYHIVAMDRWGEGILRCTIEYTDTGGNPKSTALLLIEDDGQLYWIGVN
jgi:hypothetical protein